MTTQTQATPDYLQAALDAGLSPYMHGRFSALSWLPLTPDEYLMDGNQAEFEQGYYEEAGDRFAAMIKSMMGDTEYEAALEVVELQDDMLDREDWARGGW